MLELFGAPGSAYVRKARIVLVEKGIGFVSHPTCPMQPLPSDYYNISPLGKIPALRNGDFSLADSSAICAYLEKRFPTPSLYPQKPQAYAKALWYEEYADTQLFQAVAPCYYQTILVPLYRDREPNQQALEHALTDTLPPVADYLGEELRKNDFPSFLVGNRFSIADISIASVFFNMYQAGYPLDKQRWPVLHTYLEGIFDRPSFQTCVADIEEEKARLRPILGSST